MKNTIFQRDILSIKDLTQADIQLTLDVAKQLKHSPNTTLLNNKIIAHCFFEPSTRTRLSFESATLRLGGKVMGFSSADGLSIQKGETLRDTMRIIGGYADLIVIRHALEGAARLTAEVSDKPVINAGDGANQHPTQALVDLFTIQECQNKLDGLKIALVGDLKYGRTIHSFVEACLHYNLQLYLVSPEILMLPESLFETLKSRGIKYSVHQTLEEVIPEVDILYMTRVQRERFDESEYQAIKNHYVLTANLLKHAKKNLKVLHPLPRLQEIGLDIDNTPYAHYFEQAANGVFVRQALLALLLNEKIA